MAKRPLQKPQRVLFQNGEGILCDDKETVESRLKEMEISHPEDTFDIQLPAYCGVCSTPYFDSTHADFCPCRDEL